MHLPQSSLRVLAGLQKDPETDGQPFAWNVRAKLLLYSLIIILPVVILATNVIQHNFSSIREQILRTEEVRARQLSFQVDGELHNTETLLTGLAVSPEVQGQQLPASTELLLRSLALNPRVAGIAAVDAGGAVFAS